jgi:hypothetical protein
MSFNTTKKRAQDETRNINSRRTSVRSCIEIVSFYSGLNGYTSIDEYYNQTLGLNSSKLDNLTINIILTELTELREQSKQLNQDYYNYRKNQKKKGFRAITKNEEIIRKENWKQINQLWDKFDTDENRIKKELRFAQRRKESDEYLSKKNYDPANKLDWAKQFKPGKEYLQRIIKYFKSRKTKE